MNAQARKLNMNQIFKKLEIRKEVRLAERSKAPDLSSGTRKCAWVRTPHLTIGILFCSARARKNTENEKEGATCAYKSRNLSYIYIVVVEPIVSEHKTEVIPN